MSNLKNAFGNDGWIQSSIDKSRFKSRPGDKRRMLKRQRGNRQKALEQDILDGKVSGLTAAPKKKAVTSLGILSGVRASSSTS